MTRQTLVHHPPSLIPTEQVRRPSGKVGGRLRCRREGPTSLDSPPLLQQPWLPTLPLRPICLPTRLPGPSCHTPPTRAVLSQPRVHERIVLQNGGQAMARLQASCCGGNQAPHGNVGRRLRRLRWRRRAAGSLAARRGCRQGEAPWHLGLQARRGMDTWWAWGCEEMVVCGRAVFRGVRAGRRVPCLVNPSATHHLWVLTWTTKLRECIQVATALLLPMPTRVESRGCPSVSVAQLIKSCALTTGEHVLRL